MHATKKKHSWGVVVEIAADLQPGVDLLMVPRGHQNAGTEGDRAQSEGLDPQWTYQ